jgi:hypothetical protein
MEKPSTLAISSVSTRKPVIMFSAWLQRMADEFSNRIVADAMVLASLRTGRT